ncbi:MAG: hypothetical protein I3273_06885 [Candidatus Moeniiplasma glomeromycotorum]|nr:hypothetical protein [Candidatus Moeniiplasma glomeromycotorum]MCE8168281.1 hypothetical protein [Candidatus Moeniiplasma glomeromycotorum]MCE8169811.1 hypothetical protein [Candidatus Moeniiplasma glomeromycotorum]
MNKIISIDPSATGTTGICLVGSGISFKQFENVEWKAHFDWIKHLVIESSTNQVIYEVNNSISASNRTKHISRLFKLFGAVEVLPCFLQVKVNSVPANQVKALRKKLLNKQVGISGLEFKNGIGWSYQTNKISVHELDAFLIYWIWKGKNNI